MVNSAQVGGHVIIEHHAVVGGCCTVSQMNRVGAYAFMAVGAMANKDILPYTIVEGHWATPRATNRVGLKRAGFDAAERRNIDNAIRILLQRSLTIDEAIGRIESDCEPSPQIAHLLEFRAHVRARDRARVSKLRTAVVGVGYLGRFHAQKHRAIDDIELVGVCDRDAERCRAVAAEVGTRRRHGSSRAARQGRCRDDRRQHVRALRARAVLPRERRARARREADDAHEPRGGGADGARRGARLEAPGRSRRAVQSGVAFGAPDADHGAGSSSAIGSRRSRVAAPT